GANKPMLIEQFFTESFLVTLLATICALLMAELVFPVYKALITEDIGTWNVLHSSTILDLVILVLVVGLIAGAYPAFYLSSFQAAKVLKSGTLASGTRGTLRSILITFQFAVSIAMIVCTTIVGTQLQHLKNQKLGFNKNNIVAAYFPAPKSHPEMLGVSYADSDPNTLPAGSTHPNEAWEFLKFATSKDNDGQLLTVTGQMPLRTDLLTAYPDYFTAHPEYKLFADQASRTVEVPIVSNSVEMWQTFRTAYSESVISGKTPIDQAFKTAADKIKSLVSGS
ncbi:MAG: FtsX-like permease family protein, partial [Candidatus Limnocylindrales bacterium]